MHLILTGATGLVGSGVLDAMLGMKEITKISVLSRRPVKMAEDRGDSRVNVILHNDFTKYDDPALLSKLSDANGCVWALGISQTKVSPTEYVEITKAYSLKFAETFSKVAADRKEPFHFVWVSGSGTTQNPGMLTPTFARVKGETELDIAKIRDENPLFVASSIRPSMIDESAHDAIKPYVPVKTAAEKWGAKLLFPLVRMGAKSQWSPTLPLGQFLAQTAMGRWDEDFAKGGSGIALVGKNKMPIVENSVFRRLMGL